VKVLLIGGTSEIGLAILARLAGQAPVTAHLLGRDRERMRAALPDAAGITVHDARDAASAEAAVAQAFDAGGPFDVVIHAVGVLGAQSGLDADPAEALEVMEASFTGAGALLLAAARGLRAAGRGSLVVLSSAAVERPRASNPVYGAAKAGFDALAQALSDSLAGSGVRVLVVRPGFVHTKMTAGLKPAPFATTPQAVAEATVKGLAGRAHTVWVPPVIRHVFAILRHLPRPVYRRLPL
jgi:decaprenylphospho-beta-D-erythro-pentofuranosid-2-ulose 2-reductase